MRFAKLLSVVFAGVLTFSAAAEFPWFSNGPKRRLETIVVTGNYKMPRLIAELIQSESRQTYLLFPATGGENRVIFCSPKKNQQVLRSKIAGAIRILNPKRIIILGDERYVSKEDAALLGRDIPVVRIEGKCWQKIADELTFMLNLNQLGDDFKELSGQMKSNYRPTAPKAPVTPPEETIQENPKAAAEGKVEELPVQPAVKEDSEAVVDER
jgi:hypothetical protein